LQHRIVTSMFKKSREIKHFLFSQYLADGVRITLEIILPAVICSQFGRLDLGITISLGALCVSISDAPGPVKHKRNGMLYCNIFIFLMALLTGFFNNSILLLGLLIIFSSFFFTMFSVYGNRAASIGTAALLVMILRMTHTADIVNTFTDSVLILAGGTWYMFLALLFYRLTPYRPAQRSLGECIHETAKYLRIKADLYDIQKDPDEQYKKLVAQQVVVNDQQEQVRELLYKNRELLKESIYSGRLLVLTFVDLIDLYEYIIATWYDYNAMRGKSSSPEILAEISIIIKKIANELDNIGFAIQSNSTYKKKYDIIPGLTKLKLKIDEEIQKNKSALIFKKVLVNLRNVGLRVEGLSNYFGGNFSNRELRSNNYYSKFVSHQKIDGTIFKNNLTLKSSVFRHSLRMMITCAVGYTIAKLLPHGQHSYWLLLTIIVILKPGFSLTKQRNFERFTGTFAGGLIGLLLLVFVHDRTILFVVIIFFMIGTYTFQRVNYIVMVIFMTPYILTLFNLLGLPFVSVAEERLLDTAIGSFLSFMASYFLFPHWESNQLTNYMMSVLEANISYLKKLTDVIIGKQNSLLDYKLVRKNVFLSTANLSASFNRMLSEPKNKQRNSREIYQFVVLNNVLSSNIAGLIPIIPNTENLPLQKESLQAIKRSIDNLENSLLQMRQTDISTSASTRIDETLPTPKQVHNHIFRQLDFIYGLSAKINKTTSLILT
jgi:uncharacterized membrane protein (TIGR01666 family)